MTSLPVLAGRTVHCMKKDTRISFDKFVNNDQPVNKFNPLQTDDNVSLVRS